MDSPALLCSDDCPQMLGLRKATLESQGYCVKLASSGEGVEPRGNRCFPSKMVNRASKCGVVS